MPPPSRTDWRAFLVVRHGSRWSDVLRLTADQPAVIGRTSDCAVTIRSHQASRRHAEIRWHDGNWWIRDLGSRNGTRVGQRHLSGSGDAATARLMDQDIVEIAGFQLLFTDRLDSALQATPPIPAHGSPNDDQLTLDEIDIDPSVGHGVTQVAQRLAANRYLAAADNHRSPVANDATATAWKLLFQLAYRLASCTSVREAGQVSLDVLCHAIPAAAGGIYLTSRQPLRPAQSSSQADSLVEGDLVAFLTPPGLVYQRPSSELQSIAAANQSLLLRSPSATWPQPAYSPASERLPASPSDLDSSDSDDVLLAPIASGGTPPAVRGHAAAPPTAWGYLYLYRNAAAGEPTPSVPARWDGEQLELAAAAAGVLGAALDSLAERGRLLRSLKRSRRTVDSLRQRVDQTVQIVGTSSAIQQVHDIIHRVAATDTTVLVRGESGTGKELVASAIHQFSDRRDGPLVCLNCAALSPTLLESELFGHEKGAFTGATEQKRGKFELADGGTLMLDEIGEMDVQLQAKLLRVLEGHPFERLGGHQPLRCDVRLVAATNRDLEAEVTGGRFRGDLYYRLHVVEIIVPPLRNRPSDIVLLANHFAKHFAEKMARSLAGVTKQAQQALSGHSWPGNVRELKNTIERAVVLGTGPWIDVADLALPRAQSAAFLSPPPPLSPSPSIADDAASDAAPAMLTLDALERQHLLAVLKSSDGNKTKAAAILGIERSTLDRKLKRYETARTAKKR